MNNSEALALEVTQILSKVLRKPVDPSKLDLTLIEDYGADSMDIVDIVDTLETKYGVTITDKQIPSIRTLGDILVLIQTQQASKGI